MVSVRKNSSPVEHDSYRMLHEREAATALQQSRYDEGMDGVVSLVILALFILYLFCVVNLVRFVLGPFLSQPRKVHPLQFQVTDMVSLVLLLSLMLGALMESERRHYWYPGPNNSGFGERLLWSIVLPCVAWCFGVWIANRGGVHTALSRIVVSALMAPFTCIASVLIMSLFPIWAYLPPMTVGLVYAGLVISLYACRRGGEWIVRPRTAADIPSSQGVA